MMFIASKVLAFALEPLVWVLVLVLAGVLLLARRPKLGRRLVWTGLVALVLSGSTFVPETLLEYLESRYPPPPASAQMPKYVGVVLLGGAVADSELWTTHNQVALNEHAERMTVAVALVRKHPHLKLLYTGGIASIPPTGLTEAQRAKIFFDEMGVDASRVLYEDQSRNTYENALYSATVPGVDKRQDWLLLTSAYHMPRSMGTFKKVGWNATPYPVDYRMASAPEWYDYSLHSGPKRWEMVLHELVGYYAYRLAGMI